MPRHRNEEGLFGESKLSGDISNVDGLKEVEKNKFGQSNQKTFDGERSDPRGGGYLPDPGYPGSGCREGWKSREERGLVITASDHLIFKQSLFIAPRVGGWLKDTIRMSLTLNLPIS